jgi:cytochrome c553
VAACTTCHGPAAERGNPFYPDIRGQPADYIRKQLALFRSGTRGGSEYRDMMRPIALTLSDAEVAAVAHYYSSLQPVR